MSNGFWESYIDVGLVGSYFVEGDEVIQCAPVLEVNPFECVLYLKGEMRVWYIVIVSKYEACSTTLNIFYIVYIAGCIRIPGCGCVF